MPNNKLCKVCNSPHRAEIEELYFVKGWGCRRISKYLYEKYGEDISHVAIYNHMKNHVSEELLNKIEDEISKACEELYNRIAKSIGDDFKILGEIIEISMRDLRNPKATARMKEVAGKNIFNAMEMKHKILKLTEERVSSTNDDIDL